MGESVPVTKDVMKIRKYFGNEEWMEELSFVVNKPLSSDVTKARNMIKMMPDLESTVMPKFIVFLAKKRRLGALEQILDEYMSTLYETQNIVPVVVRTYVRLSDTQKDTIKEKMKAKTGASDIKLIEVIDNTLL